MTDTAPIPATEAVARIRAMQPDRTRFVVRRRGYVDWKFGELAAYLGYQAAGEYVETVRRWYDFEKYRDCLLITTHDAFLEAAGQYTEK